MSEIISQNIATATISIVVPTLNEAENIKAALAATQPSNHVEVIVVDGGSQDETVQIADSLGVKVILSAPGRAKQMNEGAAVASGEILLFLHADTRLPLGFDVMVREALVQHGVVAGAFCLRIDAEQPSLRLVEWGVNVRSRFLQNALW